MKSILIHADGDNGLAARLQSGFDLARAFDAHITCVQATPYDSFVVADPFGSVYALPELLRAADERKGTNRAAVEAKLRGEGLSWDWLEATGAPEQALVAASPLADLILVNLPGRAGEAAGRMMGIVGEVIVHGRTPLLAVPSSAGRFDPFAPVVVAWNGAPEASTALRAAMPLLKKAREIHIVTVAEERPDGFPATQACQYLGWHGLEPVLHELEVDAGGIAETLHGAARARGASCLVMGAYGHSRFREAIFGGVTRELLQQDELPLLLGR